MMTFRWIAEGDIPERLDLRLQGWRLAGPDADDACISIVDAPALDNSAWMQLMLANGREARRLMLVGNVNCAAFRAKLLSEGFGDAVAESTSLVELSARARRLASLGQWLPRRRVVAQLVLDLVTRNAAYETVSLGLLPREFDILWRLADSPNEIVTKQRLMQDVWQLRFVPESNSIAVHMSRLKRKLVAVGLDGLIVSGNGGYRLSLPSLDPANPAFWQHTTPLGRV